MCYSATNDRSDFEVHEAGLTEDLIRKTWAGYATLDDTYEVLAGGEVPDRAALIGGFIVAAGRSDIVDPDSKLHERSGHSARCLAPGYWSLDTGKYTSAPALRDGMRGHGYGAGDLMGRPALVSLCVPAYRSEAFIAETLTSALSQTVGDVEVIVSNDGGHPTPVLNAFASDERVHLFQQQDRLGWVANCNFVLAQARGDYVMILPHDDILRPRYLEACLTALENAPEAAAAYSDIETEHGNMQASEALGPLEDRLVHVMKHLHSAFSFRAVMPRRFEGVGDLRLLPNPPTDFAVDTTFMLQQATLGELRRVAEPLYWKRLHKGNTHKTWRRLSSKQALSAWKQQCEQMRRIILDSTGDAGLADELSAYRHDPRRVSGAPDFIKKAKQREHWLSGSGASPEFWKLWT